MDGKDNFVFINNFVCNKIRKLKVSNWVLIFTLKRQVIELHRVIFIYAS